MKEKIQCPNCKSDKYSIRSTHSYVDKSESYRKIGDTVIGKNTRYLCSNCGMKFTARDCNRYNREHPRIVFRVVS